MMNYLPMKFPGGFGQRREWTALDHAVGFAIVKACLLSPRDRSKRRRYTTGHLFDLLPEILDAGENDLARDIVGRVLKKPKDLGQLSQLSDYAGRLLFQVPGRKERSRGFRYMRPILSTGIMLKLMLTKPWAVDEKVTLGEIQDRFSEMYGHVFGTNSAYSSKAWQKWRHAAPLCSALIDYLPTDGIPVADAAFWQNIERDLPNFLATARHYQSRFVECYDKQSLSRQMFEGLDLLTIPDQLVLGESLRHSDKLPRWRLAKVVKTKT